MKIFKKIAFLQIFTFSLLPLVLFSCASTPKAEENLPDTNISAEQTSGTENSLPDKNIEPSLEQENTEDNNAADSSSDFSDLTEPLTQEQNPDLPELPELSDGTENAESTDEPSSILEPQVKDELSDTKNNQENSSNQSEDENSAQGEQNSAQESDNNETPEPQGQTENDSASTLNQNDKNETSENSNIIEETDSSSTENAAQTQEIQKPSRSVTIKKNQNIDIVYPGKGWIYQGNIDENGNIDARNKNFIFGGRKLGGKDTSFTLRSRNPGTYLLHFFKNDTLTGKYIDDFLEVTVQNETSDSTEHITAPDYAEVVPPKVSITAERLKNQGQNDTATAEKTAAEPKQATPAKTNAEEKNSSGTEKNSAGTSKDSDIDTIIQTTESAPGNSSPSIKSGNSAKGNGTNQTRERNLPAAEEIMADSNAAEVAENSSSSLENMTQDSLLELAKKYYAEKKYQQAFSVISKFFDKATERLDEGLFLQGQILEEKSPVQNIKSAIESYDLVVNNYPASPLWDKANKRSIFLKRFYINIR